MAFLSFVRGGCCCCCAARAVINQVTAAVEDKPGPAAINDQRDVILSLNIDIAPVIEELKCSTYAQAI